LEEQLILARWASYLVLGLLFGLPLFTLYARRADGAGPLLALRLPAAVLALGALLISSWGFLLMTAAMMGQSPLALDRQALDVVLFETNAGWAFGVRMVALAIVVILTVSSNVRATSVVCVVALLAAIALASLAWGGHGVANEGAAGTVHLVGDVVHILAASAWIGALSAFLWLTMAARRKSADALGAAHRALDAFATTGSVIVALVVVTGVVNGAMLVGWYNVMALDASDYGRLLVLKLILFAGMLALAASNRFRLTPALKAGIEAGETNAALARLRLSLWLETGAGVTILGLVAWLGTLEPPLPAFTP
jgi:putative copper resistance protein D